MLQRACTWCMCQVCVRPTKAATPDYIMRLPSASRMCQVMQDLLTCVCYLPSRSHLARSQSAGSGSRTRTITVAARRPLDVCT
jgi:hypothetical protein